MIFVDTNYFLRFILKDNLLHYEKALKLFESASKGETKLFTSVIVFFEIYWVLSSYYEKEKNQLSAILNDILKMSFIRFEKKNLLHQTIDVYSESNLDLEDSYNLVFAKNCKATKFMTFDKKLLKQF